MIVFSSGATGNRTRDTRIFSPLLYQLSYGTILSFEVPHRLIGIAKIGIIFNPANFSAKIFQNFFKKVILPLYFGVFLIVFGIFAVS